MLALTCCKAPRLRGGACRPLDRMAGLARTKLLTRDPTIDAIEGVVKDGSLLFLRKFHLQDCMLWERITTADIRIELQRLADFRSERDETRSRRCARAGRPTRRSKRQHGSDPSKSVSRSVPLLAPNDWGRQRSEPAPPAGWLGFLGGVRGSAALSRFPP